MYFPCKNVFLIMSIFSSCRLKIKPHKGISNVRLFLKLVWPRTREFRGEQYTVARRGLRTGRTGTI
jgi:hypothetical protein